MKIKPDSFMTILTAILAFTLTASAGENLVVNGSFDDPKNPLRGWISSYGGGLYGANQQYVSVIKQDGPQKNVLAIYGANMSILSDSGQGIKVDSQPIWIQPDGRFKLTVSARSTGPGCRILLEGYRWRPGIKPHKNPTLAELRKGYKFIQVYFGGGQSGPTGGAGQSWKRASQTNPKENLSKLAQKHFNKVQFVVVHIIAIGGGPGYLYVDDVVLERVGTTSKRTSNTGH